MLSGCVALHLHCIVIAVVITPNSYAALRCTQPPETFRSVVELSRAAVRPQSGRDPIVAIFLSEYGHCGGAPPDSQTSSLCGASSRVQALGPYEAAERAPRGLPERPREL